MSLEGKFAVVSGGSAGIGLETVKLLLKEGVAKCAILARNVSKGVQVKDDVAAEFGDHRVIFEQCDVAKKDSIEIAVKNVFSDFGRIDIFVNNAGIADAKEWEDIIITNLVGTIRATKIAMKYMGKDNGGFGGTVLNVSSLIGMEPSFFLPEYGSTKVGLIWYTRSVGVPFYFNKTGVKVMVLCPGATATSMLQGVTDSQSDDMKKEFEAMLKSYGPQGILKSIEVATTLIQQLKDGENGSIWISKKGEPMYEVEFPTEKAMFKRNTN